MTMNTFRLISPSAFKKHLMKIAYSVWSCVFIGLIKRHIVSLLVPAYCLALKQVMPDGKRIRYCRKNARGKIVILALSRGLFRGDLDALVRVPDFCVLEIPEYFQQVIIAAFYPERNMDTPEFFNLTKVQDIDIARKKCRVFLNEFLPGFYKKVPVDCVISPNDRNQADLDWGATSHKIGVPYIVLFREGRLLSDHVYQGVVERLRSQGRFQGTHLIVQNEVTKRAYLEAGFVEPSQISVCGTLRMDDFLSKIRKGRYVGKKKLVVCFYFPNKMQYFGDEGNYELYRDANLVIARLALALPDVEFVVKPKTKAGQWDEKGFRQVFVDEGININLISNLKIEPFADVHDLILKANVVCGGFNSTTVLEAAVARKPVVIPCFKKYRDSEYFVRFYYRNYLHLFDIADDAQDYEKRIRASLSDDHVESNIQEEREQLFERYCSPLSGDAKEKYSQEIRTIVEKFKNVRLCSEG